MFARVDTRCKDHRFTRAVVRLVHTVAMNRSDLVRAVANRTDQPISLVEHTVDAVLEFIELSMRADEPVTIRGFGRFELRRRKATVRQDPSGGKGDTLKVPARLTVAFLPSGALKRRLNEKKGKK